MIDWDKSIETTEDRTPARVLGLLSLSLASLPSNRAPNPSEPMMVWVESDRNGWGNIFLINNEGYRCDDRALFSARQEPFIRNVPVKVEGWVLMRSFSGSLVGRYLANDHVYDSEAEAKSAKATLFGADPGVKPVHLTWEE